MAPDLVIKYLFITYPDFLKRIGAYRKKAWGELIFPGDPERLNYNHFHRLKTMGESTTEFIEIALREAAVLDRIATKLGMPQIFGVETYEGLEVFLTPYLYAGVEVHGPSNRAVVIPRPFPDGANCISGPEDAAIKVIISRVKKDASNIVCWENAPAIGAMFIAYALAGTYLPNLGVQRSFLLCPYAGYTEESGAEDEDEVPFEVALREFREHLALPPEASVEKILRTLERDNAIVHAELMAEGRASGLKDLLKAAGSSERDLATVMLIGKPEYSALNCRYFETSVGGTKATETKAFFEKQWKRYCQLRKHAPADEQGTRVSRVKDYYATEDSVATQSASVRMLAFLASNYETFSYFDPTAGWSELASMDVDKLPVEIRLHIDEANALLRGTARDNVEKVVEWCSTALYWLTGAAAKQLLELRKMSWDTFKTAVNKAHGTLINTDRVAAAEVIDPAGRGDPDLSDAPHPRRTTSAEPENFKMDLATRALVQDRWKRRNPFSRAKAHYLIAKRLFDRCNDKALLTEEFPYEPHWGRSRIFFLAECLRHLIRSCGPVGEGDPTMAALSNPFPAPPRQELGGGGCDPYEVVNFCFEKIFWQELNGNRNSGNVVNRKLARQHGAYELTGELLELMSSNGQLGRPHKALDAKHHAGYYREVAFAQLDLGQLEASLDSCERLIRLSGRGLSITKDNVEDHLDRVVVLSAMDRLDQAEQALADVDAFVKVSGMTSDKILARRRARRGLLQYLRGNLHDARETYEEMAKKDPSSISREIAHTYIATLGALGGDAYLQRAFTICLQNLFHNSSQGQHHTALGFRVALAHLMRRFKMLDAAEATLDQVSYDLSKFGCSERTYLAFLLEAGRIVSQYPERAARAYAAYLRPCADRAASLGYSRTAGKALEEAERCLRSLLVQVGTPQGLTSERVRKMLLDERAVNQVSRKPKVDPRFGFGRAQVEAWLPRLATATAIEKELEGMAAVRASLDALRGQQIPAA